MNKEFVGVPFNPKMYSLGKIEHNLVYMVSASGSGMGIPISKSTVLEYYYFFKTLLEIDPDSKKVSTTKKCICDFTKLLQQGCKCGGK